LLADACLSRVWSRPTAPQPRQRHHPEDGRLRALLRKCSGTVLLDAVLTAPVTVFDAHHPVVPPAHRHDLIELETASFGGYRLGPQRRINF
jgi:hypothetical protein